MPAYFSDRSDNLPNPLDLVEQVMEGNRWAYSRSGDEEIMATVPGQWSEYHLRFYWQEDGCVLQVASGIIIKAPEERRPQIYEVLARINERLWMGHFELWPEENGLMFRHAAVAEDPSSGISSGHAAMLIETALYECERFYPVFQFIAETNKSPAEAIEAAMLEPAGEA